MKELFDGLRLNGAKLQRERAKRKISQTALAEKLNYSGPTTVFRWESGEVVPDDDLVRRIAGALGCAPGEICD